jgi:hypothetical protein
VPALEVVGAGVVVESAGGEEVPDRVEHGVATATAALLGPRRLAMRAYWAK